MAWHEVHKEGRRKDEKPALYNSRVYEAFKAGRTCTKRSKKAVEDTLQALREMYRFISDVNANRIAGSTGKPDWFELSKKEKRELRRDTVSNGNGDNAKVHLIHFALNAAASDDITLGGTDANERAPHLASIGSGGLLAMWEGSSSGGDLAEGSDRTIYAQVLDASTGKSISEKVTVDKSVVGNRYQALKSYPDGSVAYLSKGASDTSLQV
eukprot:jgi/Phyca11/22018/fgenesh1_pg.PHYCAscaffold_405_\